MYLICHIYFSSCTSFVTFTSRHVLYLLLLLLQDIRRQLSQLQSPSVHSDSSDTGLDGLSLLLPVDGLDDSAPESEHEAQREQLISSLCECLLGIRSVRVLYSLATAYVTYCRPNSLKTYSYI